MAALLGERMELARCVLHSISHEIGETVSLEDLVNHGLTASEVEQFLCKGVSGFSKLERPLSLAIRECSKRTLTTASLVGEDIDSVIFVTESFSELFETDTPDFDFRTARNSTFDLFRNIGIDRATLFCTTYAGCANVLQAMLQAKLMIQHSISENILIVAAERFSTLESRLMTEAIAVAGDGVVAFLMSNKNKSKIGFDVDSISLVPYSNAAYEMNMASMLLEMFRSMRNAAADCYDNSQMQPEDFQWVLIGDYNVNTTLTYSKVLGFCSDRAYLKNVGRFGHIPFDPLINLGELASSGILKSRDPILLFMCGPTSCGAVVVKNL